MGENFMSSSSVSPCPRDRGGPGGQFGGEEDLVVAQNSAKERLEEATTARARPPIEGVDEDEYLFVYLVVGMLVLLLLLVAAGVCMAHFHRRKDAKEGAKKSHQRLPIIAKV